MFAISKWWWQPVAKDQLQSCSTWFSHLLSKNLVRWPPAQPMPSLTASLQFSRWNDSKARFPEDVWYSPTKSISAQLHGEEDQVVPPLWAAHSAGILSNLACEVNLVRCVGSFGSQSPVAGTTCAWKNVFGRFTKTKQDQVSIGKFGPTALN